MAKAHQAAQATCGLTSLIRQGSVKRGRCRGPVLPVRIGRVEAGAVWADLGQAAGGGVIVEKVPQLEAAAVDPMPWA